MLPPLRKWTLLPPWVCTTCHDAIVAQAVEPDVAGGITETETTETTDVVEVDEPHDSVIIKERDHLDLLMIPVSED
jgi:hypothetical protein